MPAGPSLRSPGSAAGGTAPAISAGAASVPCTAATAVLSESCTLWGHATFVLGYHWRRCRAAVQLFQQHPHCWRHSSLGEKLDTADRFGEICVKGTCPHCSTACLSSVLPASCAAKVLAAATPCSEGGAGLCKCATWFASFACFVGVLWWREDCKVFWTMGCRCSQSVLCSAALATHKAGYLEQHKRFHRHSLLLLAGCRCS